VKCIIVGIIGGEPGGVVSGRARGDSSLLAVL